MMSAQSRPAAQLMVSFTRPYQNRLLKEEFTVVARMMEQGVIMYVMKGLEKFVDKKEQPAAQLG